MQVKKILIVGNYGAGNLGDDAILAGILTDLKTIGFRGEIKVTFGGTKTSPEIYASLKKVPFVPSGLRSRLRGSGEGKAAIKWADLVIFGGGGLFVDEESWKAPLHWAFQAKACQKLKTPYLIYGQSVGPLKRRISRWLTRKTFLRAKAILVRDLASVQLLEKMGIFNVVLGTDPAISWLKTLKKEKKGDQFLLNLRQWTKKTDWSKPLEEAREWSQKNRLKLALLSMEPKNLKEVAALKQTGLPLLLPNSAKEAFKLISSAKRLHAMRLHANIFAMVAGTPCQPISYSTKVSAFLESFEKTTLQSNLDFLKKGLHAS